MIFSENRKSTFPDHALICVSGGDFAGEAGTFFEVAANGDRSCRCAAAIALLKAAIASIEACDHLIVTVADRRFGVDQGLRFVAPLLTFVGAADAAQEVKSAENFRKPLQVAVVRRWPGLHRGCDRSLGLRLSGRLARLLGSGLHRGRLRPRLRLRWRARCCRKAEKLGVRGRSGETQPN